MKKTIIALISVIFILVGCSSNKGNEVVQQTSLTETTITLPAGLLELMETDAESFVNGIENPRMKNAKINNDGSVSVTMPTSDYKEAMKELKASFDESIQEIVDDNETWSNIVKIDTNSNYSKFDVSLASDQLGLFDSFATLSFYIIGEYYQAFDGVPLDNIDVEVNYKDTTGNIINTAKLSNMRDAVNEANEKEANSTYNAEEVAKQLSFVEYSYDNSWSQYHFFEITNNSNEVTNVSVSVLYYDKNDNLISAENTSTEYLMPGFSAIVYNMLDEKWDHYELSYEATEPYSWNEAAQADLECKITPAKDKVVVQLTNPTDTPIEFAQVTILFFNGNKLVDHDWTYFTDDDSQIKPGKTISQNMDCYEDFDSYKYYITARK